MNNRKLRAARLAARELHGRTITAVHLRPFLTGRAPGDYTCDPVIELDDGSLVLFVVIETAVGLSGVELLIIEPERLM